MPLKSRARTLPLSAHIEKHDCSNRDLILRTRICNALRYTTTHRNALQHTAAHCNTPQHTATHRSALQHTAAHCNTPQRTATHRSALQYTANRRLGIQMFYCVLNSCRTQKKYVLTKRDLYSQKKSPTQNSRPNKQCRHMPDVCIYIYIVLSVCIDRNTL